MKRLTLVFDPRCPPCRRWARWVASQPAYVRLTLRAARGPEADGLNPALAAASEAHAPLAIVGERGEVWRGESALRMSLWALRAHRQASLQPRATAAALREHDAALLEHRVRPSPRPSADHPAALGMLAPAEPRPSWTRGVFQGLAVGVMGMVLLPVLLLAGFAACGLAYTKCGLGGALVMLVLIVFLLAKGLASAERGA